MRSINRCWPRIVFPPMTQSLIEGAPGQLPPVATTVAQRCETFATLRREKKLRHRDAAREMALSEGEAIALHIGQAGALRVTRLAKEFPQLLDAIKAAGPVMALTRNEAAVHERTGTYLDASVAGHMGLVLGEDIDLRIFYQKWEHGFWVEEETAESTQRSLQFFDAHGEAVHKIFERKMTDATAFAGAAGLFFSDDQRPEITVTAKAAAAAPKLDADIDAHGTTLSAEMLAEIDKIRWEIRDPAQ